VRRSSIARIRAGAPSDQVLSNAARMMITYVARSDCSIGVAQMAAVERAVDNAVTGVDMHLLDVLLTKYQLRQHLDAIKRYLLLGQGDFIETFMGLVGADLDRPVWPAMSMLTM